SGTLQNSAGILRLDIYQPLDWPHTTRSITKIINSTPVLPRRRRANAHNAHPLVAAIMIGTNSSGARSRLTGAVLPRRNSGGLHQVTLNKVRRKTAPATIIVRRIALLLSRLRASDVSPRPANTAI